MEFWDKGLVDSSRRALKPLLTGMVEYPAQTLKCFILLSRRTLLQFCCFWELSKGKVSWPLAQKAAKLLDLFAARDWGSCCDHTVRESTAFGNEHSCVEATVTEKNP